MKKNYQDLAPFCKVCQRQIHSVNEAGKSLCQRCSEELTFPIRLEKHDYTQYLSPETKKRYQMWLDGELSA